MVFALKISNYTLEFTFLKVDNKTVVLILKSAVAAITHFTLCLLPTVLSKCQQVVWLLITLFMNYISLC